MAGGRAYSQTPERHGTTPIMGHIRHSACRPDAERSHRRDQRHAQVGTATFTVKAENSVGSGTKDLSITIAKPQQYGKVSMGDYVYGEAPSTPSLTDWTGDGSVTYYYSTTNSNSGGTAWENIQGGR